MKAVIIGAGIGGMSAAIALRQIGIDTEVYERVTENKPVGAAISVWSNGVKCLNYLGLDQQTARLGGIVETMSYAGAHSGETMCRISMQPLIEQVGQRPYPIARAELQQMLMEAYGIDDIHFGMKMVEVANQDGAATATFTDGTIASADILIGADGANSITREYVLGGPVTRRYAGYVNYNGLVEVDEAISPANEWTMYVGDGKRVSAMPPTTPRPASGRADARRWKTRWHCNGRSRTTPPTLRPRWPPIRPAAPNGPAIWYCGPVSAATSSTPRTPIPPQPGMRSCETNTAPTSFAGSSPTSWVGRSLR